MIMTLSVYSLGIRVYFNTKVKVKELFSFVT